MPDRPSRVRLQLGSELAAARTLSGLDQRTLAQRLGVSQSLVSRAERGQRLLARPVLTAWFRATSASAEARDRILALAEAAHTETRTWADLYAQDEHLQARAARANAAAALVQNFQPTVLPGLLQTADYARQVIPLADPTGAMNHAAALAGRIERQGVLREQDRRFDFLIAQRLLRWEPAPGVLAPQLSQLVAAAQLDSVQVAVLPEDYAGALPWHNFVLRHPADGSDPYVATELLHGAQTITEPDSVALYRSLWDRMWAAALVDDDAVDLIRKCHDQSVG